MKIILITGLSGAGKSIALKTLEDMGCEAVDNVPLSLIPSLTASDIGSDHTLAIGTDARGRDFSEAHFRQMLDTVRSTHAHTIAVWYFECDSDVLQRRFTETRRKHPLALDRPVADGIAHERELLAPLRVMADRVFDTSEWTGADLRRVIRESYGEGTRALSLFITSFSFKRGVPRDADMVFDVRFLHNPFYQTELRTFTGQHEAVKEYIERDAAFGAFFLYLTQLILPLLPLYLKEGKSYLTIAIGCTGGVHRSVFVAEKLAGFLSEKEYNVDVRHRDMPTATGDIVQQRLE